MSQQMLEHTVTAILIVGIICLKEKNYCFLVAFCTFNGSQQELKGFRGRRFDKFLPVRLICLKSINMKAEVFHEMQRL